MLLRYYVIMFSLSLNLSNEPGVYSDLKNKQLDPANV